MGDIGVDAVSHTLAMHKPSSRIHKIPFLAIRKTLKPRISLPNLQMDPCSVSEFVSAEAAVGADYLISGHSSYPYSFLQTYSVLAARYLMKIGQKDSLEA